VLHALTPLGHGIIAAAMFLVYFGLAWLLILWVEQRTKQPAHRDTGRCQITGCVGPGQTRLYLDGRWRWVCRTCHEEVLGVLAEVNGLFGRPLQLRRRSRHAGR